MHKSKHEIPSEFELIQKSQNHFNLCQLSPRDRQHGTDEDLETKDMTWILASVLPLSSPGISHLLEGIDFVLILVYLEFRVV